MDSSSEDNFSDIEKEANEAVSSIVPEKSKALYEKCYKNFEEWLEIKKIHKITEKVMLAYFNNKSKNYKAPTMWSEYSKLKCMINLNRNVDISKFASLIAFLKRKSVGHRAKKSKVLTKSEFEKFILEADDNEFLLMKVKSLFSTYE